MAYLKPQTPLKDLNSGDYFYPLTTIDQVQKSDGSRVQDYDLGNVALEDSETAPGPGTPQMTTLMNMVYPVGSIYMSVNATSPASLFGGTWEALGGRFLIGTDGTYAAGSTGGSTTHTHTIAHTHTMAHTHAQVATTSGGPSNNTSGGTAITIAQMPSHTHSFSATSGGAGDHTHDVFIIAKGWSGWQDAADYWASYYSFTSWNNPPTIDTSAYARTDRALVPTGTTSNPGNHTHSISGTTDRQGSGSAHTHTLSSHTHTTAATTTGGASNATTSAASNETSGSASTLPPYLAVYMWKRTA